MRIVVAPDSFKGSLSADKVADAVERGIKKVLADASIIKVPMADGGEGTVDAMIAATGGRRVEVEVTGPLGERRRGYFGLLGDGGTAVIEMAVASGLPLVPEDKRNPMITTTYGTGELIKAALDHGVRRIIIGIGGSATVDGGAGMAQALGARLLDVRGRSLGFGGGELARLDRIDVSGVDPRVAGVEMIIASDVDNPLCGPTGAAAVFGPQKGATPVMVEMLDSALRHYACIIRRDLGVDVENIPGAGAAGGLGAGLVAFLKARMRPGVEIVMEAVGLEAHLKQADLAITGEGRLDSQTIHGKVPVGVARLAGVYGVPVVALTGSIGNGAELVYAHGIHAFTSIVPGPMGLEEAMNRAEELVEAAAERALRLVYLGFRLAARFPSSSQI